MVEAEASRKGGTSTFHTDSDSNDRILLDQRSQTKITMNVKLYDSTGTLKGQHGLDACPRIGEFVSSGNIAYSVLAVLHHSNKDVDLLVAAVANLPRGLTK